METIYRAYTKPINGVTFYFVKSYQVFPEYKNISPILETFGMHRDFKKACRIAKITDRLQQQQLFESIHQPATKIIPLQPEIAGVYRLKRKHHGMTGLLRLFGF